MQVDECVEFEESYFFESCWERKELNANMSVSKMCGVWMDRDIVYWVEKFFLIV